MQPMINTKSEPWLALPIFYALRSEGLNSIYSHRTLSTGVKGFVNALPEGVNDYYACASKFLQELYVRSSDEKTKYFIDKTPRYHLIVNELLDAFPDAKFIFLWRNPLAISASMIKTYGNGKWVLYMFLVDLYLGVESLTKAYSENKTRALAVSYESLVAKPDTELTKVASYLGIDEMPDLTGKLESADIMWGDRTGQYQYNTVTTRSLDTWKKVMSNPYRKSWGRKYLDWIGRDRLDIMGYDINELQAEIKSIPTCYQYYFSDIIRGFYGNIYSKYCIEEIRRNKAWENNVYFPKS